MQQSTNDGIDRFVHSKPVIMVSLIIASFLIGLAIMCPIMVRGRGEPLTPLIIGCDVITMGGGIFSFVVNIRRMKTRKRYQRK